MMEEGSLRWKREEEGGKGDVLTRQEGVEIPGGVIAVVLFLIKRTH